MNINLSIPVTIFDYKESENPLYSTAKLKIFYVGMTPDKRLFTKRFSDNLLKTISYVPVVGFYDKDAEDFKGHNKNQNIYGVVPESTEKYYEKEDDKEYAICDVILYTGRKDETGEIAQKIVGKPHSLELNPDDTTYEIHKNAEGKVEAIEFKTGSLLGLSVLGDDQKPAFTGSEFFKLQDDLSSIIKGFNTEWEKHNKSKQRGNEKMEFDLFKEQASFIERTYNERLKLMQKFLSVVYNYFYINELFEEYVIITVFDEETYETNTFRLSYSSEGDTISFKNEVPVFLRYLTEQEISQWEVSMKNNNKDNSFEDKSSELGTKQADELKEKSATENKEDKIFENSMQLEGGQNEQKSKEDEFKEEEKENKEEFGSKSLDSSERKELEAFRRGRKVNLISSFEEDLTENFINEIKENVDNYSYEELEAKLSKEFTRIKKEEEEFEKQKKQTMNPLFYTVTKKTFQKQEEVKALVDEYKD